LADKSTPLVLEALGRAAADPEGLPLHGGKSAPGLFAGSPAAKQAAQRCKDEGLLRSVRTETRGKTAVEFCAITQKGLTFLLSQVSPKQVLEDFIRTLDARRGQIDQLRDVASRIRESLDGLHATATIVLSKIATPAPVGLESSRNGSESFSNLITAHLARWHESGQSGDRPLPELFRQVKQASPQLTIGDFHDVLRKLHEHERIYLHPWTGPLHELPEPAIALMIGHEIAYYASIRQ